MDEKKVYLSETQINLKNKIEEIIKKSPEENRKNKESKVRRKLQKIFATRIFSATCIFTAISYFIVWGDAVWNWGIDVFVIRALIIEIPIQFVGILYIIAKNLFPTK